MVQISQISESYWMSNRNWVNILTSEISGSLIASCSWFSYKRHHIIWGRTIGRVECFLRRISDIDHLQYHYRYRNHDTAQILLCFLISFFIRIRKTRTHDIFQPINTLHIRGITRNLPKWSTFVALNIKYLIVTKFQRVCQNSQTFALIKIKLIHNPENRFICFAFRTKVEKPARKQRNEIEGNNVKPSNEDFSTGNTTRKQVMSIEATGFQEYYPEVAPEKSPTFSEGGPQHEAITR